MKIMKKAFSLFLALAMTVGLAVTASAESPDVSEHVHFNQDPVGIYKLPVSNWAGSVEEIWRVHVYPVGTEFMFDLPSGYDAWVIVHHEYEDGAFLISADGVYSEVEEKAFVLEGEGVWEFCLQDFDGTLTESFYMTNASQAAQLPLQPVDGEPVDQPSGWAQGYVKEAVEANIVPEELQSGYTQAATRSEFCALAVQLYETATGKTVTERVKFDDTADENVEKAAALGVISGVAEGRANPEGTITREQAAVMLAKLAEVCDKPLSAGESSFADGASISGWAAGAVEQVASNGIMNGTGGGNFSPKGQYTREQSITTMLSLFNYVK